MDRESRDLDEILAELGEGGDVASATLAELSGLGREEAASFKKTLAHISTERRRETVGRLVALAEDNIELNFDAIFKQCLSDSDPQVRSRAIEGLRESEDPSLVAPLLDLLTKDASEQVQTAAAIALGKFAMLGELGKLRVPHLSKIQRGLTDVVSDQSRTEELRRRALESVAPLSVAEVREAIEEAYRGHSARLKVSALYAMGKNCDPAWLTILIEELGSQSAEMRYESANALGEIGDQTAIPHLIDAADDPDDEVRQAVMLALGKVGGKTAKEYLQHCLSSRSEAVREAARQALDELRSMEDPLSLQL